MLDNNIKFNLFIGENFNELISLPTNQLIIKNLLSVIDKDVIVLNNSLSLPEIVQRLMDKILYGKKEIVEIISNIFSMENKSDLTFYRNIFDSNIFSSIISTNYDYTVEENFLNLIEKVDKTYAVRSVVFSGKEVSINFYFYEEKEVLKIEKYLKEHNFNVKLCKKDFGWETN